eukprot:TRINITY_DN2777_c1_g1_i1.p1 TRINITY_DN2777_c1_g1~~TRINITY_DN2777_c1_g1_i1.p1  ORF type:complete len:786 (-),score=143.25 TRINITY_DN2777_c1_g1_i1:272-2629(-)
MSKFWAYMSYVSEYKTSILMLNKYEKRPQFVQFCERACAESGDKNNLPGLLIQPVQRIPRYKMLLEELLGCTHESHPDYKELQSAINELSAIAKCVDKHMEKQENILKLYRIQQSFIGNVKTLVTPTRTFVREGQLRIITTRGDVVKRMFFLFNDALVYGSIAYATSSGKTASGKKIKSHRPLTLLEAGQQQLFQSFSSVGLPVQSPVEGKARYHFKRMVDFSGDSFRIKDCHADANAIADPKLSFQMISSYKSFMVMAKTEADKRMWMTDINAQLKRPTTTTTEESHDSGSDSRGIDESQSIIINDTEGTGAPVWVPDNYAKICQMCGTGFTVVKRRHHCRNCGKLVCGTCSANRCRLTKLKTDKPVRVCTFCFEWLKVRAANGEHSSPVSRRETQAPGVEASPTTKPPRRTLLFALTSLSEASILTRSHHASGNENLIRRSVKTGPNTTDPDRMKSHTVDSANIMKAMSNRKDSATNNTAEVEKESEQRKDKHKSVHRNKDGKKHKDKHKEKQHKTKSPNNDRAPRKSDQAEAKAEGETESQAPPAEETQLPARRRRRPTGSDICDYRHRERSERTPLTPPVTGSNPPSAKNRIVNNKKKKKRGGEDGEEAVNTDEDHEASCDSDPDPDAEQDPCEPAEQVCDDLRMSTDNLNGSDVTTTTVKKKPPPPVPARSRRLVQTLQQPLPSSFMTTMATTPTRVGLEGREEDEVSSFNADWDPTTTTTMATSASTSTTTDAAAPVKKRTPPPPPPRRRPYPQSMQLSFETVQMQTKQFQDEEGSEHN